MIRRLIIFGVLIAVFFVAFGSMIRALEVTMTFITTFEWLSKEI